MTPIWHSVVVTTVVGIAVLYLARRAVSVLHSRTTGCRGCHKACPVTPNAPTFVPLVVPLPQEPSENRLPD